MYGFGRKTEKLQLIRCKTFSTSSSLLSPGPDNGANGELRLQTNLDEQQKTLLIPILVVSVSHLFPCWPKTAPNEVKQKTKLFYSFICKYPAFFVRLIAAIVACLIAEVLLAGSFKY